MHTLLKNFSFHDSWKETWKKFDEVELSHSNTHYLLAIHTLHKEHGYARVVDVSRFMDITRGSASITLQKLKDRGYIAEDENKFLKLTEGGRQFVESVISKRRMLILFFTEILGVAQDVAEEDACKMEHLLSQETGEKLITLINFVLSNNKEAVEFRSHFKKFEFVCDSAVECKVCENNCYFRSSEFMAHE